MRILAAYGEDYPWDVRIEKLLRGLQTGGHEIRLVCRNLKQRPLSETVDGIPCHRVLGPNRSNAAHRILTVPAPANPLWRRAIRRLTGEFEPDLLLVRDLPLALLVLEEADRLQLPAVIDMAENHPAMWQNVVDSDPFPVRSWLLKNPALARCLERRAVRKAAGIFVVVDEMRDHLLRVGADGARVHIVSNTPSLAILKRTAHGVSARRSDLELIYVGNVTRNRGLQHVLRAMAGDDGNVRVRLRVVGDGDYLAVLKKLTRSLALEQRVVFHGWVRSSDVPEIVDGCDVGVIPHLKTEHTDCTVPNKLFDFMALGLPVIVSNAVPMARIVSQEKCGLVFDNAEPGSLARCFDVLSQPERRAEMGNLGRAAIRRQYHWERDLETALRVLHELADSECPAAASERRG